MIYTWNDIIDRNPDYKSDIDKAEFADNLPFITPTDYNLHISWADVSTTDAAGNFNSGWLSGNWEHISDNPIVPMPRPAPEAPSQRVGCE